MFSPTMATVARSCSALASHISPIAISRSNSLFRTDTASSASAFLTANDMLFSEAACDTRNTLTPDFAKALNMREFIPITPTIPNPDTVIRQVSFIEEIPLMAFASPSGTSCVISVPGASGLNVFFITIGIFLW